MKYFYSVSQKAFYPEDLLSLYPSLPEDLIEVSEDDYHSFKNELHAGKELCCKDGKFSVAEKSFSEEEIYAQNSNGERAWRNSELQRADIELNKVQDGDSSAKGTVTQWREYRKALRSLPEHTDFPNVSARPIAPDA